ncbi:hypothetical protein DFH08DRAFT_970397 [Mycena albidolilacea]|uniref:Uncharacterized protein n=1 Tax=Mycena albidolilacea TaxID=1033008 RepID=A0AAD6ZG53_9AGAR|nr:hypothetical protein DFH08DRAFT_970397 [Mycena albidolilacea]
MPPLTIAILGATGTFDPFLLQALATHPKAPDVRIRILTRHKSIGKVHDITEKHKNLSITVFEIDYAGAGHGTGRRGCLERSLDAVAKAAKATGVQLFVPSEYGSPTHAIALDSTHLLVYSGMFSPTEPVPTPLPASSATDPIPLPDSPFETTCHHVATYVVELLLDQCAEAVMGEIYVIRGLRRDRALVDEVTGKTKWVLDA